MKRILFSLLLLLSCLYPSLAQDLIVTTKGDSINCEITKRQNGIVYFKYIKDNKVKATLISADQVVSTQAGYYARPISSAATAYRVKKDFNRWRYGIQGGYSYRMGKIGSNVSQSYRDYLNSLKSGFTIGGDLHYFVAESIGVGVVYGLNKHKAEVSTTRDDITMHYIGASMLNRYLLANPQKHIVLGLNIGYQSYTDKAAVTGASYHIAGNTLGLGVEAGFEQELSAGALLHFALGFKNATLSKIKVNEGPVIKLDKEELENLGRLEITVGVKF
jgi:hypothetical protein